jgi:hypothetical protein
MRLTPIVRGKSRSTPMRAGIVLITVLLVTVLGIWFTKPVVRVGRYCPKAERLGYADISHSIWDQLLHRFVDSEGNVDYGAWKASSKDSQQLDEYLNQLSRLDETIDATRSQKIEFWVNAYNATTVRGILREFPTGSIQNHVSQLWGYNIWRDLQLIVGEKAYSLGEMEHSVLRPLREPRIHFAIVCGSRGCPRLRNEAYDARKLEDQLKSNTQAFFADGTKCAVDAERNELQLSPILKWYAQDFQDDAKSELLPAIADWLPDEVRSKAQSRPLKIRFGDYDWSLNEQKPLDAPLPPVE